MMAVWGAVGRRSTVGMAIAERDCGVPGACVACSNGVVAWCGCVGTGTGFAVPNRFQRHPDGSRQGLRGSKKDEKPRFRVRLRGGMEEKNEAPGHQARGPRAESGGPKAPGWARPAGSLRGQVDGDRRAEAERSAARVLRRLVAP